MSPIPITIITGFLGSGKTTLLLHLLPQLRAQNPQYKLALLKNEFGDLAVDSQLASSSSIAGVREVLNGCVCCNLVGSLSTALAELAESLAPDRIVIETSGSAFPATLAMEINRLATATEGRYVLDGVVTVIDAENWKGYEDTSFTARLQARYTDLVVFNKWEGLDERRWDECLDRLGDLEVDIAWVKSRKGWVEMSVVFGLDAALARAWKEDATWVPESLLPHEHGEAESHRSEVDVLSITLSCQDSTPTDQPAPSPHMSATRSLDTVALHRLLQTASKDEVYRIKAIFVSNSPIPSSDSTLTEVTSSSGPTKYVLNWAFGRWTCTPLALPSSAVGHPTAEHASSVAIGLGPVLLRMTVILARGQAKKWKRQLETGTLIRFSGHGSEDDRQNLSVVIIA
ncbi:unnamed protein product [Blumeria hordei]|uniref:CobW/HypB/UreG nucleotide-binding domain-containing protein n=2 Tax=Blumeria hordei TaxID=2867405 RepID=A0A383UYI6_BLUHO|nr:CobW domain-containing protein [Blumeria hordei DH14]SZF04372.1 unnamed protein product [Blumeria hordei]